MRRPEILNQVRRTLLLAAGPGVAPGDTAQLEFDFSAGGSGRRDPGQLQEVSERAHSLLLELVLLIQMERLGLVASPLRIAGRQRLGLGSGPTLRLLGEWENSPTSDDIPWKLGTQSAGREQAFVEGLGRVRALAEASELAPVRVSEIVRRLYLLVCRLSPEDDLPGLIYAHSLRQTARADASGKLAFRADGNRAQGLGAVNTPPELAGELSSILFAMVPDPSEVEVLDPACGSGAFLMAAARRSARAPAAETGPDPVAGVARFRRLHGVDLDPRAARLASWNLTHVAAVEAAEGLRNRRGGGPDVAVVLDQAFGTGFPYFLGSQIQAGNSLLIEPSSFSPGFLWERRFPKIYRRERPGFDLVLGNPPWVSYGLRDRTPAPEEERTYYERLYPAGTQYKLTLYPLFMELALRLCRAGGTHGFLVPDSLLTGHHFSRIRRLLLSESDLVELTLIEAGVWPGVTVGHTVLYAVKKKQEGVAAPPTVRNRVLDASLSELRRPPAPRAARNSAGPGTAPGIAGTAGGRSVWVPAVQYSPAGPAPLRIYRDESEMAFLSRIQTSPFRIRDVAWSYSGLIARHGQKSIQAEAPAGRFRITGSRGEEVYRDENAGSRWHRSLLSGGEITPFRVNWRGGLVYVPEGRESLGKVYKSGFDLARYDRPKIFLRQTGDSLIAAVDRTGLYCLNNLHLLGSRERTGIPPLVLAGVLMSGPVQRAYRISTLERARPLAQVDLTAVEALPYPCDPTGAPLGACLSPSRSLPQVRRILRSVERDLSAGESSDVLRIFEAACRAGAGLFEEGPLAGREVVTLLIDHVLQLRENEAAAEPVEPPPVRARRARGAERDETDGSGPGLEGLSVTGSRRRRNRSSAASVLQQAIDEMVDLLFRVASPST